MPPQASSADFRLGRWVMLGAVWSVIAATWCALLPAVAGRPAMQMQLQRQESLGIDASAMFYSELPAMEGVNAQMERVRRREPRAFWVP